MPRSTIKGPQDGAITFNEGSADVDFRVETNGNANMLFVDGGDDAVVIGHNASRKTLFNTTATSALQIEGTSGNTAAMSIARNSNDDNGPQFVLAKSNGTAGAAVTVVTDDALLGRISWQGADGTQTVEGARIEAFVDGTPGADDMPSRLTFSTTADNASSVTERMRIDSSGNLFVGKTSSSSANDGFEYNNGGQLAVTRNNDTVILANRRSNHGDIIDFRIDNNLIGSIGSESGKLQVNSDGGSNLLLASEGTTRVAIDSARLYPNTDDSYDLGLSSSRFDDIFATNGTIQTSDQNEKQDIASATTKELNVAKKLSTLFKTFRWKDKVTEKGDKARTHSGIIAQDIQSAFSAEGLDASDYGLFTSDTWWEKDKETYETKEEAPEDATERTRLGVRYPELFSFIFSSIEARLTALEGS